MKKTKLFFLLIAQVLQAEVHAQAFQALDVNNINATFNNTGSLFWDQQQTQQFEAPKGSGKHSIFASSLWVGGVDTSNQLRVSAARFNSNGKDFHPGPVTDDAFMASEEAKFDRIFKFTCAEIQQFKDFIACQNDPNCDENAEFPGYVIPDDILDFPGNGDTTKGQAQFLGFFEDVDGDNVYEPLDGDAPIIKAGDVMLYFILNDKTQGETGGDGLMLDIYVTAYAYFMSGNTALDNTVFVNYRIVNRSANIFTDSYLGVWTDFDLGNAQDDFLGSAPEQNMYFAYNGDAFDQSQGGAIGYQDLLPAQAVVFLAGPYLDPNGIDDLPSITPGHFNAYGFGDTSIVDNERLGMTSFMYHNNSIGVTGDPSTDADYYNMLRGQWKDGSATVYGGTGYTSGCTAPFSCVQASYMFSGDEDPLGIGTSGVPQTPTWSEASAGNNPGDRRGIGASGPFTFFPYSTRELDIAYVFAQLTSSTTDPYDAVNLLKQYVASLPALDQLGACQDSLSTIVPDKDGDDNLIQVFPNPTNGDVISIKGEKQESAQLLNLLGEVISSFEIQKGTQTFNISHLAKGVYVIKTTSQSILLVKE